MKNFTHPQYNVIYAALMATMYVFGITFMVSKGKMAAIGYVITIALGLVLYYPSRFALRKHRKEFNP